MNTVRHRLDKQKELPRAIDLPRVSFKITFGEDALRFVFKHGDEIMETALKFSDEATKTLGKIFKKLKTAIKEGKITSTF